MSNSSSAILSIGVDIAKETFVAAGYLPGQAPLAPVSLPNTAEGYEALRTQVSQWQSQLGSSQVQLCLEPTGGYEARLAYFAHAQQWAVSLVNPSQVRDWIKSLGQRAKTDQIDAGMLARFGAKRAPARWQPPEPQWLALQQLLARRQDYQQMLQAERNRLAIFLLQPRGTDAVRHSLQATLQHLQTSLAEVEAAIDELIARHPPMQQQAERLDSIPGVGPKTIAPLLSVCARLYSQSQGRASAKQLTALVGLDPLVHSSGRSVWRPPRISKKGDKQLRRTLFMASLGAIRGKNALHDFYQHLLAKGKKKKVALVACARKILVWAWAVFTSQQPFDPAKAAPRS